MRRCFKFWAIFSIFSAGAIQAKEVSGPQFGTWTLAASPIILTGEVSILPGTELVIEPGVVVKAAGPFKIRVNGILKAVGAPNNRIIFTSQRDADFFFTGSTGAQPPTTTDWGGLEFGPGSSQSVVQNAIIRYCESPISAERTNALLKNIIITDCQANIVVYNGQIMPIRNGADKNYSNENTSVPPVVNSTAPTLPPTASQTTDVVSQPAEQPQTSYGVLSGLIYDSESGESLPAANIEIIPSSNLNPARGAASGMAGRFRADNLQPDVYTVRGSYLGYETTVIQNVRVSEGQVQEIKIALKYSGLQFNPITVTASRRPEAKLEAPAAVSVIDENDISQRPAITPTEFLKGEPAVDVASTGLNSAITVVRGFNNVFSGSLLSLVDHRIARIPSLRVNAYQLIPNINQDIERIEVVLGPGSALYGPNSANGVMHMITKSPIGSEGTTVSIGGGERALRMGSFRHAKSFGGKFGYKLSGQYYQGHDWESFDIEENQAREAALQQGADPATLKIGARDFDVEKFSGDARADFQFNEATSLILNAGFTSASNIELTGIGAGQAVDWKYGYAQGRFKHRNLFVQAFTNLTNAGDSFVLRTGDPIVDKSRLYVAQVQHALSFGETRRVTWGTDVLLTRPNTERTINGENEDNDSINEFGFYVQSELDLSSKLRFVAAGRIDEHNFIEKPVFSPRAALVLRPNQQNNFRFTFNRAFSTPTSNTLFLDLLQESVPNPLPAPLQAALGLSENIVNIRVKGVPAEGGFSFELGNDGRAQMRSQFDAVDGYSEARINSVWPKLRAILVAANPQADAVLPETLSQNVPLAFIDPVTGNLAQNAFDAEPIRETVTNSFEFGYKGVLFEKLSFDFDIYRSHIENFVSPLIVITPTVHAAQALVGPVLEEDIVQRLVALGTPEALARSTAQATVAEIYNPASPLNLENIPVGVLTPTQLATENDVLVTYRNFGSIWLTGADARFSWSLSPKWRVGGNYSFVSRDLFENLDGVADIALNAPKNKAGAFLNYSDFTRGLNAQVRFRFVDGFPVNSGAFVGEIEAYTVVDFNANFNIFQNTQATLSVQNLLNRRHREMIGAPEVGRLAIIRFSQSF